MMKMGSWSSNKNTHSTVYKARRTFPIVLRIPGIPIHFVSREHSVLLQYYGLKQTRVGSPEATASLLRPQQGGELITAVVIVTDVKTEKM